MRNRRSTAGSSPDRPPPRCRAGYKLDTWCLKWGGRRRRKYAGTSCSKNHLQDRSLDHALLSVRISGRRLPLCKNTLCHHCSIVHCRSRHTEPQLRWSTPCPFYVPAEPRDYRDNYSPDNVSCLGKSRDGRSSQDVLFSDTRGLVPSGIGK